MKNFIKLIDDASAATEPGKKKLTESKVNEYADTATDMGVEPKSWKLKRDGQVQRDFGQSKPAITPAAGQELTFENPEDEEDEGEYVYDRHGNYVGSSGMYDAGGHFSSERGAEYADFVGENEVDEAAAQYNHMDEREYQTFDGWRRACRAAYPGCGFRGDRDIAGATLNGRDVGEWDGAVGSVYNKDEDNSEDPFDQDDPAPGINQPMHEGDLDDDFGFTTGTTDKEREEQDAADERKSDRRGGSGKGLEEDTGKGKVKDTVALKVKEIAKKFFGTPYSAGRIGGGTVYRISIPIGYMFSQPYRYVKFAEVAPQDIAEMKSIRSQFLDAVKQNGINVADVDVKFHIMSGIYASVRIKLGGPEFQEKEMASEGELTESAKPANKSKNYTRDGGNGEHSAWSVKLKNGKTKKVWADSRAKVGDKLTAAEKIIGYTATKMSESTINEKSTSEKQARTMAAAAHNPKFAKKVGIPSKVAKEFNKADTGTKQLSNAMKENKQSKKFKVILESVTFEVADQEVAKILRRFPHETKMFQDTGELGDHLFDALFDHYMDAGEMPYGVAKARDGDPYTWVGDQLDKVLGVPGDYDASADTPGDDLPGEMGDVGFDEGMGGDIMPLESADLGPDGTDNGKPNFHADGVMAGEFEPLGEPAADEDWTEQSMRAGESGRFNDNGSYNTSDDEAVEFDEFDHDLDETDMNEEILNELTLSQELGITDMLEGLGLDHGLDFFFDDGLVAIGKTTARVIINALKNNPSFSNTPASIESIDGEEVRLTFNKAPKVMPDRKEVDALADEPEAMHDSVDPMMGESKVNEEASFYLSADGTEDVVNLIKRLSGLGDEASVEPEVVNAPDETSAEPSMRALTDLMTGGTDEYTGDESCGGVDEPECEPNLEVEGTEADYANEPDPVVHTSTTQMINQGNDLNRPKKMDYPLRARGDNPMSESAKLMQEYEDFKKDVKESADKESKIGKWEGNRPLSKLGNFILDKSAIAKRKEEKTAYEKEQKATKKDVKESESDDSLPPDYVVWIPANSYGGKYHEIGPVGVRVKAASAIDAATEVHNNQEKYTNWLMTKRTRQGKRLVRSPKDVFFKKDPSEYHVTEAGWSTRGNYSSVDDPVKKGGYGGYYRA